MFLNLCRALLQVDFIRYMNRKKTAHPADIGVRTKVGGFLLVDLREIKKPFESLKKVSINPRFERSSI